MMEAFVGDLSKMHGGSVPPRNLVYPAWLEGIKILTNELKHDIFYTSLTEKFWHQGLSET